MVIHRLWTTDTGRCVVAYRVEAAFPGLVTVVDLHRGLAVGRPSYFFVQRRLGLRWPWQKLTGLLLAANSSATLRGPSGGQCIEW